jgi:AraC-like DNA-binding protein
MELFFDFAFIAGILVNGLILFLLFKNKDDGFHKKILLIIFVFILLTVICFYGFLHKVRLLFYPTFIFEDSLSVLIGPMLLLYLKSIVLPTKKLFLRHLSHFIIPIFYILFISIPLLISMWNEKPVFNYISIGEDYFSLGIIYSLIYCIFTFRLLKKVEVIIKNNYSNTEGIDLKWVQKLLIGTTLVISIDVLSSLYELFIHELTWNTFYLTAVGVVVLIMYLGYNGIMQSKVLLPFFLLNSHSVLEESEIDVLSIEIQKPIKENDSEMNELEDLLESLMQNDKPYLNEELSLNSLAVLLSITDKKVSYLLNQHKEISFYDYINGYRVEEVKLKMKDSFYDHYTLLGIAFECGFNSKSSFNRIFKKVTSVSPSEYKKALKTKE